MKLPSNNLIPYLSVGFFIPTATAFIEPEASTQTVVAQASFVVTSALPPPNTVFYQLSDAKVPNSLTSDFLTLEQNLGIDPGVSMIDGRSGKVANLFLQKPILPGSGQENNLLWSVGVSGGDDAGAPSSSEEWSEIGVKAFKNWLIDHQSDLKIDAANELFPSQGHFITDSPSSLDNVRTAVHGEDGDMIQMSIQRTYKGVKVVGSRAAATIKRGNLINVGLEQWGDINERFSTEPRLTEEDAYSAITIHTGLVLTGQVTCKPELQILTTPSPEDGFKSNSLQDRSEFAQGYNHRLVWRVCPKFVGQDFEMMEGIVDANSGQVLSFQDTNDYLQAVGHVYPFSNDKKDDKGSLQPDWPMPFMKVGSVTTDSGGNYELGGSQTARLTGTYVEMRDQCSTESGSYGIASLISSGGIDWGGSAGTDCVTPGFGTAANTHSSRSGFYELNRIIEIGRSRLPSNTWLKSKLISNMNINSNCNAFFNGQSVNFYRSGGNCANTGELAGVFDHEWGHGLDYNDLTPSIAAPSGEGIADLYTALRLNDSCIGRGFYVNGRCNTGGDACDSCTGVRDIDYMKKAKKQPSTYTWAYGPTGDGSGKCNKSVHCLGYVYSEAVWSLYTRELQSSPYNYDENTALEIVTRLTYIAAGNIQTWYGGYMSTGSGVKGGCGSNSGFLSYLAADDDNGNMNDGTPHTRAIYKAFNDQEIACDLAVVQDSGCVGKPTVPPIVTVVAGNTEATLSWNTVAGASKYQVFRTEGTRQCSQGKVLVATLNSNVRTYTDSNLANGRSYYYIVVPKSNDSCFGPSSSCAAVTPVAVPGLQLNCDSDPLLIPLEEGQDAPAPYRNCEIFGVGGFTGVVNLSCISSSLPGVSCNVSSSSVTVSSSTVTAVVAVQASSSATASTGSISVSASKGSITASSLIPVTIVLAGGPQVASYDVSYKAPRCILHGTQCSSANLLEGRGTMAGGGNEQNGPNTVDGCPDGNLGTRNTDESLDRIVVRAGYANGNGVGSVMVKGGRATIIATVFAWNTGATDFADFYYATDSDSTWNFIATKQPSGGGVQDILVDYELPHANLHKVRVTFRYNGSQGSCDSGDYNDRDDLVFAVADAVTAPPVTPNPSKSPTKKPTKSPTKKPTSAPSIKPTTPPTNQPTNPPTKKPTKNPTPLPTINPTAPPSSEPTKKPTSFPTPPPFHKPTNNPTDSPVNQPTTLSPVTAGPSIIPTNIPTQNPTNALTPAPTTSAPAGPQVAFFDSNYGAPRCASPGNSCSTGSLVAGRGDVTPIEPNLPNTIDGCTDGNSGIYKIDESIERIIVRTGSINDESDANMVAGEIVTIHAFVHAWQTGASDTADFYYATDASNPDWQYIGSITPPGGQSQELKMSYRIPAGSTNQVVRVQFRYGGNGASGPCMQGNWNDRDDLVFTVDSGLKQPTKSPVKMLPPPEPKASGPQQASYDPTLTVPRCSVYGLSCDSLSLLNGRDAITSGNEPNRPNTLDSCSDGSLGSYHSDESIDKIIVRSGELDGSGTGVDMAEGGRATIIATVYPYNNGGDDFADFYYASDAFNPIWQFIGTKQPVGGGLQELTMTYDLPSGPNQAVRVNFRWKGAQGTNGACSSGSYDDTDDLAFTVKSNPSFTEVVSLNPVAKEAPKDAATDEKRRADISLNESGIRRKQAKAAKRAKKGLGGL